MKLLFKSFMVPFSAFCLLGIWIYIAEHPEYQKIVIIAMFSVLFIGSWIGAYLIMGEKY